MCPNWSDAIMKAFMLGLMTILLLVGCKAPPPKEPVVQSVDPESTISALSSDSIAQIESYSQSVAEPKDVPFPSNEASRRAYLEWYRKGYAYAFITGKTWLRDQV